MASKITSFLIVALKGIGMGAANVVPGVSGGTIAFLTGIYERLINSIKAFDLTAFKLLFAGKFKAFWAKIDGTFLFALLIGIVISIFSLAKLMVYLLDKFPIPVWSFFFGLIVASIVFIFKDIKGLKWTDFIAMLFGIAFGAFICIVSPTETTNALWFIFLCGAIAICTMILPGISGSFILLLLGKYYFIMEAVHTFDIVTLVIFALGAVIGLIAFSHFLSWLLKKCYNGTLLFLAGLMIGSLLKVWPWQREALSGVSEVSRPVWPAAFAGDPQIAQAVIWFAVGALLVFVLEYLAGAMTKKSQSLPAQK